MKVELDAEGSVLSESLVTAKKFGVKCEETIEPCKFIVAYLTKLSVTKREVGSWSARFLHSARCERGVEGVPFLSGRKKKKVLRSYRRKSELHSLLSNS